VKRVVVIAIFLCLVANFLIPPAGTAGASSVVFSAAGDYGTNAASWPVIRDHGGEFHLALGDFSYDTARGWCSDFKTYFNNIVIVSGNHDDGDMDAYARECPFPLGVLITGSYGYEYFFDYPAINPLIRVVMASPDVFSADIGFIRNAIVSAKESGIPWTAFGSHKVCIEPTSDKSCQIGTDLLNMLLDERVDLILQAHAHTYSRSHQLTCASPDGFIPECVADSDGHFVKGAGTVVVVQGIGGRSIRSSGWGDPDSDYFATTKGGNGCSGSIPNCPSADYGMVQYTLTETSLNAKAIFSSGEEFDPWSIGTGDPPPPQPLRAGLTVTDATPTVNQSITLTGLATGGSPSFNYGWVLGDGNNHTGRSFSYAYSQPGNYSVTLTVTDSVGATDTESIILVVSDQPPPPPPVPLTVTITVSDNAPVRGQPVTFTGTVTGGTPDYTLDWTLGDGNTHTGESFSHAYAEAGTYTVTLMAMDSEGAMDTASQDIEVSEPPPPPTPPPEAPTVVGWGGIRLDEAESATQVQKLADLGFNAYRVSFESQCGTNPKEMGPYDPSLLQSSIDVARSRDMWIVVDYHGFTDLVSDEACWLQFWQTVTMQFGGSYEKIIWEPINEPTGIDVAQLSQAYQAWIDQGRTLGDTHWVIVQNLCSFSCGFSNFSEGYPTVTDPLGKVMISLHAYMDYGTYSDRWNSATAEEVAGQFYDAMVAGSQLTGWASLNTEGGAHPLCNCAPDAVLTGSAGYSNVSFHFIQTLTRLLDQHTPRMNWMWWPAGGWTDTPGAGSFGALAPDGWGSQLSYGPVNTPVPPPPPPIPQPTLGDVNRDRIVNIDDVILVLSGFTTQNPYYDINGDGRVNINDLIIVLSRIG